MFPLSGDTRVSPACGAFDGIFKVDEVELGVDGEVPVRACVNVASNGHEVGGHIVVPVQALGFV